MKPILLIEDHRDIAHVIHLHLADAGYDVQVEHNGHTGLTRAQQQEYELIILDLMLPGLDGLEICKQLRAQQNFSPVLMLTAKSSELDRVIGLEVGADDYLAKPFSVSELTARVKALIRRRTRYDQNAAQDKIIERGALSIHLQKHSVTLHSQPVNLTSREFDLLTHFAKAPGQVFSRTQLLDKVWGFGYEGYEHTVNSHINRLRAKIERDPSNPDFILTVWGVGYKFNDCWT